MISQAKSAIEKYLKSDVATPFFYVVGDAELSAAKRALLEMGFQVIKTSDFCKGSDCEPCFDWLRDALKETNENRALLGLGEYLALRGESEARVQLDILRSLQLEGKGKVVLLLRGVAEIVDAMRRADRRFERTKRLYFSKDCKSDIRIAQIAAELSFDKCLSGLKQLLTAFEEGGGKKISAPQLATTFAVKTDLDLDTALCSTRRIASAFDLVAPYLPNADALRTCGDAENWAALAREFSEENNDWEAIFRKRGWEGDFAATLSVEQTLNNYEGWLYFLALQTNVEEKTRPYLRRVLDKTFDCKDLKANIVRAIWEVDATDSQFWRLYAERKDLLRKLGFSEAEAREFVEENRRDKSLKKRLQRLTDLTATERREAIRCQGWSTPETTKRVYPDLIDYTENVYVNAGGDSDFLTDYFNDYKRQKLAGNVESEFERRVEEIAQNRLYNRLPTRDAAFDGVLRRAKANGESEGEVGLYWCDALGVEYLAFIEATARKENLRVESLVARSAIPSITSLNRACYDDWPGEKIWERRLDEIKHAGIVDDDSKIWATDLPLYLADELEIIGDLVKRAAQKLKSKALRRVVITSDHGASRLAVLSARKAEFEKYDAETPGKHNGRCRLISENVDEKNFPYATEENGWLALADYGRFKGSRAATIETHGGATLEETLVPVVELTLCDFSKPRVEVELLTLEARCAFNSAPTVEFFTKLPLNADAFVTIETVGAIKRYPARTEDGQHFSAVLTDVKKKGVYRTRFEADSNVWGPFELKVVQGGFKKNFSVDDI